MNILIFKHFLQKIVLFPIERKLQLPEHPVHMCKMGEKPIGRPIYATQFLASRG